MTNTTTRTRRKTRTLWCQVCQRGFTGSWAKCCSQECRLWWGQHDRRIIRRAHIVRRPKRCAWCNTTFTPKNTRHAFCTEDCKSFANGSIVGTNASRIPWRNCTHCGSDFIARGPHARCLNCKGGTVSRANLSRTYKQFVLERDGNLCRICAHPIDLSLHHNDRMAFTLDHIIPVERGGTNNPDNLQPAHRCCNSGRAEGPQPMAPASTRDW